MARGSTNRVRSSKPTTLGRFGEARESWVRVNATEFILYEYHAADEDDEGTFEYDDLPDVKLAIRLAGVRRPARVSLTAFRVDELDAFEKFITRAIEKARPVCAELDARAQKDFEDGDDTHARLYRPVPEFHVRTREQREHSARLRQRPEGPADDDG